MSQDKPDGPAAYVVPEINEQFATDDLPSIENSAALFKRAGELIPMETMLLSKHPFRMAPGAWPAYYRRAWGSKVEDMDGNVFIDFSGDVGATLLGRADPDVAAAVSHVIEHGNYCNSTIPMKWSWLNC